MGIFNQKHFLLRQARAAPEKAQFLHDWIYESLVSRIRAVGRDFASGLVVGPHFQLSRRLDFAKRMLLRKHVQDIKNASFECMLSVLDMHTIEDVPAYLTKIHQLLKPDSLFMAVFYGGDSLIELRHACQQADLKVYGGVFPRVHPMLSLPDSIALVQHVGFQMPVVDHEKKHIMYDEPKKAWTDLKVLGATNCLTGRQKGLTSQHYLESVVDYYPRREEGRYIATLDLVFITAWTTGSRPAKHL